MNIHHLTDLSITLRLQVMKNILEIMFKQTYLKTLLLLKSAFISFNLTCSYLIYLGFCLFCFALLFLLDHAAYRILVSQPRIKSVPPEVKEEP